jgi:hypothetical protein
MKIEEDRPDFVNVSVDNDHPNGFPGGDPESVESDYGVSIEFEDDLRRVFTVSGKFERVREYLTDYALEHLL